MAREKANMQNALWILLQITIIYSKQHLMQILFPQGYKIEREIMMENAHQGNPKKGGKEYPNLQRR